MSQPEPREDGQSPDPVGVAEADPSPPVRKEAPERDSDDEARSGDSERFRSSPSSGGDGAQTPSQRSGNDGESASGRGDRPPKRRGRQRRRGPRRSFADKGHREGGSSEGMNSGAAPSEGGAESSGEDRKGSRPKGGDRGQRGGGKGAEGAPGSGPGKASGADGPSGDIQSRSRLTRKQRYLERKEREREREAAALAASEPVETEGLVEISPKGFGFLREKGRSYQQCPEDVFITPEFVRTYGLRDGLMVRGVSREGVRGPQLVEILAINDCPSEDYARLPYFEELTAINPNKKLTLETDPARMTTRVIDLITPIGRGQRGLIVAPPRTGKTTLLHHIAEGLLKNYEGEVHLMVLLVDERPEEVTDFERSFPDVEIFSSSNDGEGKDHTRIALLAIERAKRLVEAGRHVVILMDSITRLARAFNTQMRGGKRGTASGGLVVGALEVPRRIFAAARNTREAGSLTIIATALIQTNSKADEAIFQEFKGTGNMELVLDRQISQNYVYPSADIHKSGTRREELLLAPHVLEKVHVIRRGLGGYKPLDAMEWLLRCMERYPSNAQMLLDIKTNALA